MKWKKIKIKTLTQAEDILVSALYDIGLEGAQIEDKVPLTALEKEQMFVDIPPEAQEDDGVATLSFFAEMREDGMLTLADESVTLEVLLDRIQLLLEEVRIFCEIGEGTITVEETEDLDWINNWKQYFHQFCVGDLLVVPSWEEAAGENRDKKLLHIDPGTAFGTGMHETTQLCLRALKKYVTGREEMLDVGTGSGILGIYALMCGVSHVTATDLDPCALEAVKENLAANGYDEKHFTMILGNVITEEAALGQVALRRYDIVTANILAEVLTALIPVVITLMKPGAVLILSGIIEEKEETVKQAVLSAGLELLEADTQGEWVGLVARKP